MYNDIESTMNTGFTYIEKAYEPNISHVLVITEELKNLIQYYFLKPVPQFRLINDLSFDDPMTLSTYDTIHISCLTFCWAQISFQLSHEFCHLMIGKEVASNLRWLEESFAEASSLFFMKMLSIRWRTVSILGEPDYSVSIESYVSKILDSCQSNFKLLDIGNPDSDIYMHLVDDCYDRNANRYIAAEMLPILETNTFFWSALPKLADIPNGLPLAEAFDIWKQNIDNSLHTPLELFKNLFIAPDSSN